jgi:hypothetical protein
MIYVDSKLGSRDLVNYFPLNDGKIATLVSLSSSQDTNASADIAFSANGPNGKIRIAIEVKEICDLVSSIFSGRLQGTQIPHLKDPREYDEAWLLYYGTYRCGSHGQLQILRTNKQGHERWLDFDSVPSEGARKYSYHASFLESPDFLQYHVYTKRVIDLQEAAIWIYNLYHLWNKPWNSHKCMKKLDRSRSTTSSFERDVAYNQMIRTANSFPTLGDERSEAAANHFESTLDMVNASIDEWANVETVSSKGRISRLGPVRAKTIYDIIRKRKSKQGANRIESLANGFGLTDDELSDLT